MEFSTTSIRPLIFRYKSCDLSFAKLYDVNSAANSDDGVPSLDVREGEGERVYKLEDMYSRLLFIALCRQHGATVYRRPRQRVVSVCVRTTLSKHGALWQRFLSLSAELDGRLAETTQQFLVEHCEVGKR